MTKKEYYLHALVEEEEWTSYLLVHTPDRAPENSPEEFLAFCGTVGLGEIIANGSSGKI